MDAYRVAPGKYVNYLPAHNAGTHPNDTFDVRWRMARIISVTDQQHVVLGIESWQTGSKVVTQLNGGVAVPKWTAAGQTNVWRPY
jgi:hypothetical protein